MPRVTGHTPFWLQSPNPGHDLFYKVTGDPSRNAVNGKAHAVAENAFSKRRRTIANRGTEVFYAVGNELRWADLVALKEKGEALDENRRRSRYGSTRQPEDESYEGTYRVLKHTAYGNINALVISPNGSFMAIATSHTVHIISLPSSSRLVSEDTGPIKLKCAQIGPTDHVLEGSSLAAVLWHPLGHNGNCLVTVTSSAIVRLWEVNRSDRRSFDTPSLAVDLKRLANATTKADAFKQTSFRESIGFSPDWMEMDVASAAFGNSTTGWSPMTLWIAMTDGSIYALCPLLPPNKWEASQDLMKSLSLAIETMDYDDVENSNDKSKEREHVLLQQRDWFGDLRGQEFVLAFHGGTDPTPNEVFTCPAHPGVVPRLQGPFDLFPELDDSSDVLDLLVLGIPLTQNVDDELAGSTSASTTFSQYSAICVLNESGKLHTFLDLDGIEAQWLTDEPSPLASPVTESKDTPQQLFHLETIALPVSNTEQGSSICFTRDVVSPYTCFVNHESGVWAISLGGSLRKLSRELSQPAESGAGLRIQVLLEGDLPAVESLIRVEDEQPELLEGDNSNSSPTTACIVLEDSDLGYFLLTAKDGYAFAASLDPAVSLSDYDDDTTVNVDQEHETEQQALLSSVNGAASLIARPAYRPPETFAKPTSLHSFKTSQVPPRYHHMFSNDEIRFSPTTLEILTRAHLVASRETHTLGLAVADLFRRCERLRDEYRDQISRAREISDRVDSLTGEDEDLGSNEGDGEAFITGKSKLDERFQAASDRQQALVKRYEALWKRVAGLDRRDLSERERAWFDEVEKMGTSLIPDEDERSKVSSATTPQSAGTGRSDGRDMPPWRRLEEVHRLRRELVTEAERINGEKGVVASTDEQQKGNRHPETPPSRTRTPTRSPHPDSSTTNTPTTARSKSAVKVPSDLRKVKVARVMELLERESALVEAAAARLRRLSLDSL